MAKLATAQTHKRIQLTAGNFNTRSYTSQYLSGNMQQGEQIIQLAEPVVQSMGMGRVFKDHAQGSRINSIDFNRTTDLLAAAGDDDTFHLYNVLTGKKAETYHSRKYGVSNICFTHSPHCVIYSSRPSGQAVLSNNPMNAHAIRYHSLHDNKYVCYCKKHTQQVNTVSMSPKNDFFISAGQDKQVCFWDLRVTVCQGVLTVSGMPCARIDEQGLVFGVATESGIIKLYDVRSYDKGPFDQFTVAEEANSPIGFSDIKFSNDGKKLLASCEGKIYVLDAFTGAVLKKFSNGMPEGGQAVEATFSADNRYILAGCDDRAIRIWNVDTGAEVAVWQGHAGIPGCLKWSPRRALCASACSALVLWVPNMERLKADGVLQSVLVQGTM